METGYEIKLNLMVVGLPKTENDTLYVSLVCYNKT